MIAARLEARALGFRFGSDNSVFDNWNARLDAEEVVAITGPSGRGKSTLLYLLGLVLTPTSGIVLIDGREVSSLHDSARALLRAGHIGFVFQDAALDPTRTVLENVLETALYRRQRPPVREAIELLEQLGVQVRLDRKPGQVSGGQAQRIALCRALLGNPGILLADEPTGNLDSESSRVVMDTLRGHAENGALVLIASHDPMVVATCDRTITL